MPTHYKGTPQEELALNTYIKLSRATSAFESRLAVYRNLEGLTVTQFGVLEVLFHMGSMCQNEIGHKLLKSGGNMTLVIDNLEKRQLVRRERKSDDRRMIMVNLTDEGRKMITRIFPHHVEAITREMNVLTPDEQATLGRLCRKLGTQEPD
jgi:MarR family transcriptional regulator, 2-MHQ and catechol-resistance regulon repressor